MKQGSFLGLKLTDQVMKLLHCVLDPFIREIAGVDSADDICIISQLQDKYIAANKPLYLSFVDPKKAEESSLVGLKRAFRLRSGLYVSSMTCPYIRLL